jgi:hypothetical protein
MLTLVPVDEAIDPALCRYDAGEWQARIRGRVLERSEQCLGVRIVVRDVGRQNEGMMPSHCSVEIMVLARIGAPLSE